MTRRSFEESGFDPGAHDFVSRDVFEFLEEQRLGPSRYELVVCDPPSFARKQSQVEAAERQMGQASQVQARQQAMMSQLMMAQAQASLAQAAENVADAGLQRAKTVTEMAKTGQEARLEALDRVLRYLELQIEADKVRLAAQRPKEKAK